ncbi:hypothetical protein PV797_11025 [Clostridiaceae bacterium M8S5]|nr:hypothetical protein PV797_11025 [Clostridiaceae bacterium M8S5]
MKNNKVKHISLITVLLIIAIALSYGIYIKSQSPKQADTLNAEKEKAPEVKVEDIEKKDIDVPKIKVTEPKNQKDKEGKVEKTTIEVEKPIVPPKPEPPKEEPKENDKEDIKTIPIKVEEDKVKEGDIEENPNPPKYEETTKVKNKPVDTVKNPVEVTPEVPENASKDDKGDNLVPDSKNPFLKRSEKQENNNAPGGHNGTDFYQDGRKAGEGDKF